MRRTVYVAVAVAIVAVAVFALVGCGTKVPDVPNTVATVNGQAIPAPVYLDQTNRRVGREVLSALIEQNILLQWAKDEGVEPTQEQIDRQIEILKRDGMYDDQVKVMGEQGLTSEIKAMQSRINLVKKMKKISKEEMESTYNMMKNRYVHGPRKHVALIINSDKSRLEEAIDKIKEGEDFDKVAGEYSGSQFAMRGSTLKVWVEDNQPGLPPDLAKAAKTTKLDETSDVVSIGQSGQPTQYVVLKVVREQEKSDLKLKDVKEEIEDAAAMQKAMMDEEFQKEFNEKKKDAKIDVKIERLSDVVNAFKNPPEPMPMMSPGPAPSAPEKEDTKPAPKPAEKKK